MVKKKEEAATAEKEEEEEEDEEDEEMADEELDKMAVKPDHNEQIGNVFELGKGMVFKVDSIESGKVICVRMSGEAEYPKGIFLTEEVLRTIKPKQTSDDKKEVSYTKGFEFELSQLEYRVEKIEDNRVTCFRTIQHDSSPLTFEMPLLQLGKLSTKPKERTEEELGRHKSYVEGVKEQLQSGETSKKVEKKRVSYAVEEVQVKVKASAFEEKAKEPVVVKEDLTSPKRPKPGNIASRVAGLNIDPTKLKQGAYDAAKIKKKEDEARAKSASPRSAEEVLSTPSQEMNTDALMNKSTIKSKRRPRTQKKVGVDENPDYGPGAEEVSPRRYTAVSPQDAQGDGSGNKPEEPHQERTSCCTIM